MNRLRKGDNVIVISGKSKGKQGVVSSIIAGRDYVLVEGVNFIKKHVKPNPSKGIEGGIIQRESPIHTSNVALYNSTLKKADRIGFKLLENNKKVRYFKSNNELLDK